MNTKKYAYQDNHLCFIEMTKKHIEKYSEQKKKSILIYRICITKGNGICFHFMIPS